MLARHERLDRPVEMQVVRQADLYGVDLGIVQKFVVRTMRLGNTQFFRPQFGLVARSTGDGSDLTAGSSVDSGYPAMFGHIGTAENTPTNR